MLKRFKLIILPALLLGGCAGVGIATVSDSDIRVETVKTAVATITHSSAYLEDGRLVVAGVVRRLHEVKLPGHVDIILRSPEGVIDEEQIDIAGLASKRKGGMDLPFAARFESVPSPGTWIVVRYHDRFDDFPCAGQG